MKKKKNSEIKDLLLECLFLSMEDLRQKIQTSNNATEIAVVAQSMTKLAEAYKTIRNN